MLYSRWARQRQMGIHRVGKHTCRDRVYGAYITERYGMNTGWFPRGCEVLAGRVCLTNPGEARETAGWSRDHCLTPLSSWPPPLSYSITVIDTVSTRAWRCGGAKRLSLGSGHRWQDSSPLPGSRLGERTAEIQMAGNMEKTNRGKKKGVQKNWVSLPEKPILTWKRRRVTPH